VGIPGKCHLLTDRNRLDSGGDNATYSSWIKRYHTRQNAQYQVTQLREYLGQREWRHITWTIVRNIWSTI